MGLLLGLFQGVMCLVFSRKTVEGSSTVSTLTTLEISPAFDTFVALPSFESGAGANLSNGFMYSPLLQEVVIELPTLDDAGDGDGGSLEPTDDDTGGGGGDSLEPTDCAYAALHPEEDPSAETSLITPPTDDSAVDDSEVDYMYADYVPLPSLEPTDCTYAALHSEEVSALDTSLISPPSLDIADDYAPLLSEVDLLITLPSIESESATDDSEMDYMYSPLGEVPAFTLPDYMCSPLGEAPDPLTFVSTVIV
jgi:hypothetical protein